MSKLKPAEYKEYVQFMSLVTELKKAVYGFNTDTDFAKKFKLNINTLVVWKKKEEFWKLVEKVTKSEAKSKLPEVLAGIVKSAKKGNPANAKLFLEYVQEWVEKREVENTQNVFMEPKKAVDFEEDVKKEREARTTKEKDNAKTTE